VRYVGCSNYPAHLLADAVWTSKLHNLARFDSAQPRYNILFRMIEDEILPLCKAHGIGIIVYNPLAAGMLTGRYKQMTAPEAGTRFDLGNNSGTLYQKRYWKEAVFEEVNRLGDFFSARGTSLTHAALAWVLMQEGITSAIVGASKPEQLRDSLGGVGMTLDAEALAACDDAWFNLPRERDLAVARR